MNIYFDPFNKWEVQKQGKDCPPSHSFQGIVTSKKTESGKTTYVIDKAIKIITEDDETRSRYQTLLVAKERKFDLIAITSTIVMMVSILITSVTAIRLSLLKFSSHIIPHTPISGGGYMGPIIRSMLDGWISKSNSQAARAAAKAAQLAPIAGVGLIITIAAIAVIVFAIKRADTTSKKLREWKNYLPEIQRARQVATFKDIKPQHVELFHAQEIQGLWRKWADVQVEAYAQKESSLKHFLEDNPLKREYLERAFKGAIPEDLQALSEEYAKISKEYFASFDKPGMPVSQFQNVLLNRANGIVHRYQEWATKIPSPAQLPTPATNH